jgi:hypothetical protein
MWSHLCTGKFRQQDRKPSITQSFMGLVTLARALANVSCGFKPLSTFLSLPTWAALNCSTEREIGGGQYREGH